MIQRIQSVYLLLVAVLMVVAMALPIGNFVYAENTNFSMMTNLRYVLPDGTLSYVPCMLFILLAAAAVIAVVTVFLYRKRMQQIRLTKLNSAVLVVYYLVAVYFILTADGHENSTFIPVWSFCLPLVSIILNGLAIHAIRKDEMLVRSYDRIR